MNSLFNLKNSASPEKSGNANIYQMFMITVNQMIGNRFDEVLATDDARTAGEIEKWKFECQRFSRNPEKFSMDYITRVYSSGVSFLTQYYKIILSNIDRLREIDNREGFDFWIHAMFAKGMVDSCTSRINTALKQISDIGDAMKEFAAALVENDDEDGNPICADDYETGCLAPIRKINDLISDRENSSLMEHYSKEPHVWKQMRRALERVYNECENVMTQFSDVEFVDIGADFEFD